MFSISRSVSSIGRRRRTPIKILAIRRPKRKPNTAEESPLKEIFLVIASKKATKEEIVNFLVTLSGKKEKKIRFWTPSQSSRKDKQVRSVELYFYDFGRFYVGGNCWFGDSSGLSRGVIVDSAKQTKKIRGKSK